MRLDSSCKVPLATLKLIVCIAVEDVVRRVPVCRSLLQRRFKLALNRTVHDEILRVRLNRAKELLRETDMPLPAIAEKAGFRHQEYMGAIFKAHLGVTPARFRRTARGNAD
jgi:LacI family transcriptional regulator